MSKIEAGKFELSPMEFNFEKMLQRVVNVVSLRVEEKQQKFTVYIDRDIPRLLVGDDQRLAQVLTNLLGNSVKFTPEKGAVSINTYFLGEEDGVCTIKIAVRDSGIGMSLKQQEQLFRPFMQAETHTSRKYGGTGLGLSISKSIIDMMNGDIQVESTPGAGSTFSVTVKLKRGGDMKRLLAGRKNDLKSIRILAVDDDAYILNDFKGIVERFGATCDTARNEDEAMSLVRSNGAYNIYFVDWEILGPGDAELSKKLKGKYPEEVDSLVIMVSFAESNAVAAERQKTGIDKFLQKPLFPTTIEEIINEYICAMDQRRTEEVEEADITGIFEGLNVLLAEDIEINREIVLALLEPTLLNIDCAENGVEAVRMFSETPEKYKMIFMDLQMPELDGFGATRHIRGLDVQTAKTIPIIAMTANVFKEDIENCLAAGMDGHIGKPLNFADLIEVLKKYLLADV